MKRILSIFCIVAVLMMSMATGTVFVSAATTSTASATDVYASGNWMIGETVSANYTYYDPSGKAETADSVAIQWYRLKQDTKTATAISGATSKDYTLTSDDSGYWLYFTVKTTNADGQGTTVRSPIYTTPSASTITTPALKRAQIIITGGAQNVEPGVTLRANAQTAFPSSVTASDYTITYQWRVRDTIDGENTNRTGSDAQTYTITEADYGKFLEVVVTMKDKNNAQVGDTFYSRVKVGTKFGLDTTVTPNNQLKRDSNIVNSLWYQSSESIYTYTGNIIITADAGKSVRFDGFFVHASNAGPGLTLSYSNDNATWSTLTYSPEFTKGQTVNQEFTSAEVLTARYFKLSYTPKTSTNEAANSYIYSFYPFLSAANRSADCVDIDSIGCSASADNSSLSITKVIYGTPLKTLTDSIVTSHADAVVSVTDASGNAIEDIENIRLTTSNASDYRVKVAYGDRSQSYTIAIASAIKTNDFSSMVEGTKYMNTDLQAGYIPGSTSSNFLKVGTVDTAPYGIRETLDDGSYALKVVSNGNVSKGNAVLQLWHVGYGLNSESSCSFSCKVKPDDNTVVILGGKVGDTNGKFITPNPIELKTDGIYVSNGKGGTKRVADFAPDCWYELEIVTDYKNKTQSLWINGVNYGMNLPYNADDSASKSALAMNVRFDCAEGGANDINYVKDIAFNKVWDSTCKVSADGKPIGMTLYKGDTAVDELTAGIYTAKGNGNVFSDDYYAAVYKYEYANDTSKTVIGSELIKAYHVAGSANAQITGIEVPATAFANYDDSGYTKTAAVVKLFAFNNIIMPVVDCSIIE